jgi:hypothetical protein
MPFPPNNNLGKDGKFVSFEIFCFMLKKANLAALNIYGAKQGKEKPKGTGK